VLLDLVIRDPVCDGELESTDHTLALRDIQTCWCLSRAQVLGDESEHIRLACVVLAGQQVDLAERSNQLQGTLEAAVTRKTDPAQPPRSQGNPFQPGYLLTNV
jgi:hypothetical protein